MARTPEGDVLTRQHRQRQLALRAAVIADLTRLWPLWDLEDFDSFDRFIAAAVPLIRARNRDSAGLAAGYYQAFRTVEGVDGNATPQLAERPDVTKLRVSLRATGLTGAAKALKAGMSPQEARRAGFVRVSGAAVRHTLNGARETIIQSADRDSQARGYQRVTSGNTCDFCLMLSSRGPVYETQSTASFKPHDFCDCHPEPVYPGGEWRPENLQHQQTWNEAQQWARANDEMPSGTANDALNAFRRFRNNNAA